MLDSFLGGVPDGTLTGVPPLDTVSNDDLGVVQFAMEYLAGDWQDAERKSSTEALGV